MGLWTKPTIFCGEPVDLRGEPVEIYPRNVVFLRPCPVEGGGGKLFSGVRGCQPSPQGVSGLRGYPSYFV